MWKHVNAKCEVTGTPRMDVNTRSKQRLTVMFLSRWKEFWSWWSSHPVEIVLAFFCSLILLPPFWLFLFQLYFLFIWLSWLLCSLSNPYSPKFCHMCLVSQSPFLTLPIFTLSVLLLVFCHSLSYPSSYLHYVSLWKKDEEQIFLWIFFYVLNLKHL